MPDLLLASVEYGGYISIVKFGAFLAMFFLWLPLVGWVYNDAKSVGAKNIFWTTAVFGAGAAGTIVWLMAPLFIIGALFFLIVTAVASIGYLMHRDAKVPDFQRILTVEHTKSLFANKQKKLEALQDFLFITPNNNEVPIPDMKTSDFIGFKSAYDILSDAMWRRVSDIILSPTAQDYKIVYYVDGAALKQPAMPKQQAEYFVHFLKNMSNLSIDEKRKPQKGKFRIYKDKVSIVWEITTKGSTIGEQVQLRLASQQETAKLSDISLTDDQYEQLNKFRELKQGLFIVAGPRKSGVTTTFYAMMRNHDPFIYNVSTLERKTSAELPHITQNVFELSDSGTTTYAKKLQEIMRVEPNVVGVADCQDPETAQVACKAAKDGKVVYVTLEADNVVKALGKWIKLVGNSSLATESLVGISNQRMLRTLCETCKQAYEPNKEVMRKFNIPADKAKVLYRPGKVMPSKRGKGKPCRHCQETGYVGRTAVFEIIVMDDNLRDGVKRAKSLSEISAQFRHVKMLYLQEQALRKVIDGTTAINEMVRVFSATKKKPSAKKK